MKFNIREIAKSTGVSPSTVSRVLNGKAEEYRISQKTAAKVKKAAENSFYNLGAAIRKNKAKRKDSGLVGLLIPSESDPYFAQLVGYVIAELGSRGFLCILLETNGDDTAFRKGAENMLAHGIQALIAIPNGADNSYLELIDKEVVPVVLLDHFYAETELSYVTSDNFGGAISAVRFLVSEGHRDIVCLQGDATELPAAEREKGYIRGMEEAGLQDKIRVIGGVEFSEKEGYRLANEILDGPNRPSAIFTLSHGLLVGVMRAVHEHGMDIPSDIELMSFDNNIHTDHFVPCVRQPIEDMARLTADLIVKKIKDQTQINTHIRLAPELVMANHYYTKGEQDA